MSDLAGKRALVTGASRGIGFSIARQLVAAGCTVGINGRDEAALHRAVEHLIGDVYPVAGDVSQPEGARQVLAAALDAMGSLDILVCNVGSGSSVRPGTETYEEWQRVFGINLWSTTNMVEAAKDALAATHGAIVCISSICGVESISGAPVTYSAAKAALNAYVKGISRPLGQLGVRINAIAPGNILFEGSVWERKLREDRAAVQAMLASNVPLGKLGTPDDVARLVAYLASEQSSFSTGSIFTLDGGQTSSF